MAQRSKRKKQQVVSRASAKTGLSLSLVPWKFILQAAIIVLLGLWIYTPSLHGLWLWDDDFLIQNNDEVHDPSGIYYIWFEPWTMIDFFPLTVSFEWLEWQIWPNDPFAYHLVSLVLHLFNAMLVWHLFRKLGIRLAWLGALLFTVHPVIVESVSWMAEVKNTFGMPPFLLALSAWISYDRTRRPEYYWATLILYLIAMLAKPTVVAFPVIILLYAWWKHGRIGMWANITTRSELVEKIKESAGELLKNCIPTIPFFIIAIVDAFLLIIYLRHGVGEQFIPLGGPLSRLACAGLSLIFYFSKCILPLNLMPIYPQWIINPPSLIDFLPWPVMAFGFWWLWRRREQPWARAAIFGFGYFFIMTVPFVGWRAISFMRFQWVMDHFLYVPIIGLAGLAAAAAGDIYERLPRSTPAWRIAAIAVVVTVLATFTIGSHRYAKVFINRLTYWTYTSRHNFVAWPAHNNRGNELLQRQRYEEATEEFKIALALNPVYTEAHNNLGYILSHEGRYKEAEAEFREALKYTPDFESAQLNLAETLRLEAAQQQK